MNFHPLQQTAGGRFELLWTFYDVGVGDIPKFLGVWPGTNKEAEKSL